jgi:hypothetical protein
VRVCRGLLGVKKAIFEKEYHADPIEVSVSSEAKGERTEETLVFHPPLLDKATKMVRGRITILIILLVPLWLLLIFIYND